MPLRLRALNIALLPLGAATILLSGCQLAPPFSDSSVDSAHVSDPMKSAPPITRGLDAKGLSTLLTAELAGQRGNYQAAVQGYIDASQRYPSSALGKRATFAARFSESPELLQAAAERWRQLAPGDTAPNRLLAAITLQQGRWAESLKQRLAVTRAGDNGELTTLAELAVADSAPLEPLLIRLREHLATPNAEALPHHSDVLMATALIEASLGEIQAARQRLEKAQALSPDALPLWLAKARLALETAAYAEARQAAKHGLELNPGDVRFILLLAQAEIRLNNISAAEGQTDALLASHGGSHDLRLALAQLYLEEGHGAPARRLLQPLIGQGDIPNLAYYLLGAIAEAEGEVNNALLYYRQVSEGEEFIPARANAARMLIAEDRLLDARAFLRIERMRFDQQFNVLLMLEVQMLDELGRTDDADALLNREIERTPDDNALLYQRAMRAWGDGDLAQMEANIKQILQNDPGDAMALNALGYTLADENASGRLDEAQEMIERAHELDPDNPAIMDSLGWVYYRQGDPERALPWLERAYAQMPDQEVAAHLAEVLHALGRVEEARAILMEAMRYTREHSVIDALLKRHPELAPHGYQP
ncbi:tetratricopeptide repeat protein [Halomonas llamarensis]|uniref:Tetratricopeptide repeat protein n=1 Tax=Halomonas llamarensis TaxID=2945104 RepID=A0ABT0SPQ9_9GAMM|nr:tetratricopeptide repeat protein [Halomonas llamarensis]MCL7929808.1 tetratricopeptide repeat protein [Halomonas llamarensis]